MLKIVFGLVRGCCINFPHELTCQVLTNQGIKNWT